MQNMQNDMSPTPGTKPDSRADSIHETASSNNEEMGNKAMSENWVVRPDPDLEDLIPSFMQNRKNELVDLESAVVKSDFDAIRRLAHTWKGICRPYGFLHLETLSRNLEVAGEHESKTEVEPIVAEIKNYLANVRIQYS